MKSHKQVHNCMNKPQILILLICCLLPGISNAAISYIGFNFFVDGFDNNATVNGTLEFADLNEDWNITINEIINFNIEFSGNSKVPEFSFGKTELETFWYGFDHGDFGASSELHYFHHTICGDVSCSESVVSAGSNYSISTLPMSETAIVPLPAGIFLFISGLVSFLGYQKISYKNVNKSNPAV